MIKIKDLKKSDVGKYVIYNKLRENERCRIKSWNDDYIFVVYKCNNDWRNYQNYTGQATDPKDLEFV